MELFDLNSIISIYNIEIDLWFENCKYSRVIMYGVNKSADSAGSAKRKGRPIGMNVGARRSKMGREG